jgi:hypothetical protein
VVADAQRVGHRGERRVHRAGGREAARVDDVEVVDVVCLAGDVEDRRARIGPEAHRAALVRDARERDALVEDRPARDRHVVATERAHQLLELGEQPPVRLEVVVRLGQVDAALAVDGDAVLRVG